MGSIVIPEILQTPDRAPTSKEVAQADFTIAARDANNARQAEEARIAETTKRPMPDSLVDWAIRTYGLGKDRSVQAPSPRSAPALTLAEAPTGGRRPLGYGLDAVKVPRSRPIFEDESSFADFVNGASYPNGSLSLNLTSDDPFMAPHGRGRDFQRGGTPGDFEPTIRAAAREYGVDPHLIHAMIEQESNYNPRARSKSGAMGLMQLVPSTAQDLGVEDPYDPEQNIRGGVRYIAQLLKRYHGNLDRALTAYNWGMGNVDTKTPAEMPEEARLYAPKVRARYERIRRGR